MGVELESGLEYGKVYKVRLLPLEGLKSITTINVEAGWYQGNAHAVGYLTLHLPDKPTRSIVIWPKELGGDGEVWRYPVSVFKVLGEVNLDAVNGTELVRHIIF